MPTHGLFRQYASALGIAHRVLDAIIVAGCLWLVLELHGHALSSQYQVAIAWSIAFFLLVSESVGLYASWRTLPVREEATRVLGVWAAVVLAMVFMAFLFKVTDSYSRLVMLSWACVVPLALLLDRAVIRYMLHTFRANGRNSRTVAIVGAGALADKVLHALKTEDWMGLRLVGVYDDRAKERLPNIKSTYLIRGKIDDLLRDAKSGKVDYVYIALPMKAERRVVDLVGELADTTVSVYFVPDVFISDLTTARWLSLGGVPVVSVFESPFFGVDGWLKRLEDVVLGTLILAVVAIPMLAIAIGVKLTSPGPVLFRQRRYGLNGRVVEVWKFRTMTVAEDGDTVLQAKEDDPRVTRFGAFLRRTSLDELPQFFNVLAGDLSIVGPRPHAVAHNEQYRRLIHGYMLRHKVKPGITGLAQVNGWRGETDTIDKMRRRVEYDLEYVRYWSLWLDIKIIFLTIVKGFTGKNVY
jgi:putative colanic acid biosynthesis UDP-glucose lipid carrier transferase